MATRGSVKGERRVVTILFADVKGSTALAERLDPEDVLEIMNGAFEVLVRPIVQYEGTLTRLMGDAVMALFGAPIAHEDDPERACRAALDIVAGAQRYGERLERERGVTGFNVRVGVNTGLVVVAEVGADFRVEYTAMGDAVNLAARMESAAEPGTILITDATCRLVKNRFITESVGDMRVKGRAEPVRAYRVLRSKSLIDVAGGKRGSTRFIGRESEMKRLKNSLLALEDGSGGILAVVGEPGIGKSRLVREAQTRWFNKGIWAEWQAPAFAQGKSFEAARMLLCALLGSENESDEVRALDMLCSKVDKLDKNQAQEIFPYLSLLLEPDATQKGNAHLTNVDPELLQRRIHHAYNAFIHLYAKRQPIVVVAEDMQWYDRSSLDLLRSIVPSAHEVPVLFLLVYRLSGEHISTLHENRFGLSKRKFQIVNVPPLTKKESALHLATLSGTTTFSPPLQREILTKTDGNPLFIEAVVQQAYEGDENALTVPDTLRGVIMARMDSLPPREQGTLQAASVLGRSFQKELLTEIMKEVLSPELLSLSLAELVRRGFIIDDSSGSRSSKTPAEDKYFFTHNLTHQVVYDSILLSQRKILHREAGEAIESIHASHLREYAVVLAEHYGISGDGEKAFQHLLVAGERAGAVFAHAEALEYYTRAAALEQTCHTTPEDLRRVHEGLGDAHMLCAHYKAALEHYEGAIPHTNDPLALAVLHRKRGTAFEKSGRYNDALSSFEEALKSLEGLMDLAESARVFNGLARVYCRRRQFDSAIDVGLLSLDLMRQLQDDWGVAQTSSTLGVAHCSARQLQQGIEFHQQALKLWQRLREKYGIAATLNNLGWAFQQMGDSTQAETQYRKCITLCEEIGLSHTLASACDNLSQLLAQRGNRRESMAYLKKAVALFGEIQSHEQDPTAELWLDSGTV